MMAQSQRASPEIMMDILQGIGKQRDSPSQSAEIDVTKRTLMRSANVNHQQLGRYLEMLDERGFIRERKENGSLCVTLSEAGKQTLAHSTTPSINPSLLQTEDQEILRVLEEGRNTAANIATETGYDRQYVYNRLRWLVDKGFVSNVGNGVFERSISEDSQG